MEKKEKHIIYILDSLSASCVYDKKNNTGIDLKKIQNNFFSKISKNALFFRNNYGYGNTHDFIHSLLSKVNINKSLSDTNFRRTEYNNPIGYYNKNAFKKIFFNNSNHLLGEYYKKQFPNFLDCFDVCQLESLGINKVKDDFITFCKKKKINEIAKDNKIFFYIHEMSPHDNKFLMKGTTENNYLKIVNQIGKKVKKDLEFINYDEKIDTLIFLSDHGATFNPSVEIWKSKKIKKKLYDRYYSEVFNEKKIKIVFFIKNARIKKNYIDKNLNPNHFFPIIDFILKNKFKFLKKKIFSEILDYINLKYTSLKAPPVSSGIYINNFITNYIHSFFIFFDKKKIVYCHNHPSQFIEMETLKNVDKDQIKTEIKLFLSNYFNIFNFLYRIIYIFFREIFAKILKLFKIIHN